MHRSTPFSSSSLTPIRTPCFQKRHHGSIRLQFNQPNLFIFHLPIDVQKTRNRQTCTDRRPHGITAPLASGVWMVISYKGKNHTKTFWPLGEKATWGPRLPSPPGCQSVFRSVFYSSSDLVKRRIVDNKHRRRLNDGLCAVKMTAFPSALRVVTGKGGPIRWPPLSRSIIEGHYPGLGCPHRHGSLNNTASPKRSVAIWTVFLVMFTDLCNEFEKLEQC